MQGVVGHVRAAFLGQQQEGDHRGAAGVEVAPAVGQAADPAAAGPGVVVLAGHRVIDPLLDVRQHLLVAGAQVVFAQRDAAVAEVPGVA